MAESIPEISIIIPVYNGSEYIEETVNSVIAQTCTNWELIITNDGSTDQTGQILKALQDRDSRILVVTQQNGGMGKARNAAIAIARGEYLAFIDADDLWVPEKLDKQLAAMRDSGADLVYTSGYLFKGDLRNIVREWRVPAGMHGYDDFFVKQLYGFTVPVLSVLVKRSLAVAVGGFEESRKSQLAADYQLWLKIMDKGARFFGVDECLFFYRIHEKQSTFGDTLALGPVLWSLKFAKLESIPDSLKLKIMNQRLDRYIIHNADQLSAELLKAYISLYFEPLGNLIKGIKMQLFALLGKQFLQRYGYRYLDLSENPNN